VLATALGALMAITIIWLQGRSVIARELFDNFGEAMVHAEHELGRMKRTYAVTTVRIEENKETLFLKTVA
jgi:hypothetical protein